MGETVNRHLNDFDDSKVKFKYSVGDEIKYFERKLKVIKAYVNFHRPCYDLQNPEDNMIEYLVDEAIIRE